MAYKPSPKDKAAWKQAVEDENIEALQELQEKGFDLEYKMEADCAHGKMTALQLACFGDWKDGALWLIEQGAKVGGLTRSKCSALWFAVLGGDEGLVEALLAKDDANINVKSVFGTTPLHNAVSGDAEMARLLLQHGADPMIQNDEGQDALAMARAHNGPEMQHTVQSAWTTQSALLQQSTPHPAARKRPRRV